MAEIRPVRHQSKAGKTFFVRSAHGKDAAKVLVCAHQVIAERIYSVTSPEEFLVSLEQEIQFLEAFRKDPLRLFLLAETEDKEVVGTLDFSSGHLSRHKHTGEFGMGVLNGFRGEGIGSAILQALLDWAVGVSTLEKINLTVHSDNERALALYKKFGFEIEGVRKRETRFESGRYVDAVLMGKFLRSGGPEGNETHAAQPDQPCQENGR